ncbi:Zn(II)2Cys6 transcription factor [Aspergillus lucknowensis]|uniref:Zn(2)-C6 fungal-type domain-containing protein n=1 Tax=Aspergillus lucknowensis TaxID=176173 RepID=A0ABR4LXE7_9EURO
MPAVPGRGCDNCRKLKKKCDEVKPVCTRCARRGLECIGAGEKRYKFIEDGPNAMFRMRSPKPHAQSIARHKPTWPKSQNYGASCTLRKPSARWPLSGVHSVLQLGQGQQSSSDSPVLVVRRLASLSEGLKHDLGRAIGDSSATLSIAVAAFNQFIISTCHTGVGTARIGEVMRTDMIHVALNAPYLMYAILAAGALHINRTCPGSRAYELAEAHFTQQAAHLLQVAIQSGVNQNSIDGLVSASMLMGLLSLYPPSFSAAESWVFTRKASDMNWLCLQGGLACIVAEAGPLLQHCIWAGSFSPLDEWEGSLYQYDIEQGREGLHDALADLCEINNYSTRATNAYYMAVKLLSPLLVLEATSENAALSAKWIGRLEHAFVALLRHRDSRALVVFAHWMGLLCTLSQFEQWVEGRIRQECVAICMYLESMRDPVIQPYLEYPATSCGYILRDTGHQSVGTR